MMDETSIETKEPINENDFPPDEPTSSTSRPLLRVIGLILVLLAVVLGVYVTVAYLAWNSGQDQRTENARQALEDELAEQMIHARSDVEAGNYVLALRRLEWILNEDSSYPGATPLRDQAKAGLDARLTPSPTPVPSATPIVASTPLGPAPEEPYAELSALVEDIAWDKALPLIIDFQAQFPNYRRQETDTMLYNAYIEQGINLLNGEQVELGLLYLAQAEKLGDLPLEAEDYRIWAELYLLGIGYYGVNWGLTVFYFRDLCAAAPYYQDACQLFYEALATFGDQHATALDWCPARALYDEALQLEWDEDLDEKLSEARLRCLDATPTPTATSVITGTIAIIGTPSND